MKCLICDCIFPESYSKCPVCGNHAITKEQFVQQDIKEDEVITPYVEFSSLDDYEMEMDSEI